MEISPAFFSAYALLFEVLAFNESQSYLTNKESTTNFRRIAHTLIATEPNSAEAHNANGWLNFLDYQWAAAESEFAAALLHDPDCAIAHEMYGWCLTMVGRTADARHHLKIAEQLVPDFAFNKLALGLPAFAERRYDEAAAAAKAALLLDPNFAFGHEWLGRVYEAQGDFEHAIQESAKGALMFGENSEANAEWTGALRKALQQGPTQYWRARLDYAASHLQPQYGLYMTRAAIYAELGEREKALDQLDEAFAKRDWIYWILFDPSFEALRSENRFQSLLRSLRW